MTAERDGLENERFARVVFSLVPQVTPLRFQKFMARFGSASAALEAPAEAWGEVEGLAPAQAERLRRAADEAAPRAEAELEGLARLGGRALVPGDEEFPASLSSLPDAPSVLYVRGGLKPVDSLAVALVGTRHPTAYGRAATERLARDLCRAGVTVVSGLARGIDTAAHAAALAGGGRTAGVMGSGFRRPYPPENRRLMDRMAETGAVLSEFPLDAEPDKFNFPRRNRIISGLSLAIVVVEADEVSGALITARLAAEQGRDVFAVPGPVFSKMSRGPHRLLKQGARLVEDVEDVLDEIEVFRALSRPSARRGAPSDKPGRRSGGAAAGAPPALSGEEGRLFAQLSLEPCGVDDLSSRTGLPASAVSAGLLGLELKGLVRNLPGGNYVRSERGLELQGVGTS
jgi:DNA processing protein